MPFCENTALVTEIVGRRAHRHTQSILSNYLINPHGPAERYSFALKCHSDFLHDPAGCVISDFMNAHYAVEAKDSESKIQRPLCSLGCVAAGPCILRKPPTDLNGWENFRKKIRHGKTCVSYELTRVSSFQREQTEAMSIPELLERRDLGGALLIC